MTNDNGNDNNKMSFRSTYHSLVPKLSSALKDFQSSSSKFQVLQTIHPSNPTKPLPPSPPSEPPKTLFILDSSFNPPSIAHQSLAQSALSNSSSSKYPKPHRMLLLFSTMNADKAPSAASFDQRLTLMTIFASDLLQILLKTSSASHSVPAIDIGVTTAPYYTDKSAAIASEGSEFYGSRVGNDEAKHVHLVGFDTITRFFAPKYYPSFSPPLSALDPYFDAGHSLRVTLRPDDSYGSVDEQKAFVKRLEDGEMEDEGGKREWAKQVVLVEPNERAGVSSTKVRKAAKAGEWDVVETLCTRGVAGWVRREELYEDDDRGAKMA